MTTLYAQPYDTSATGFFFDSLEDYDRQAAALKNSYGAPVEEFELQVIDGDDIDCDLAKAFSINQANLSSFLKAVDDWEEHQKQIFIIAVGECGYSFDETSGHPDDFDVDIYELDSLKELAEHFIDEGLYGEIPETLAFYIDFDAIARDLAVEYSQITIAGKRLIYTCR